MNVSSLTSTSATAPVGPPPRSSRWRSREDHEGGGRQARHGPRGAEEGALDGGSTMSSLAAKAGISQDDLVSTIAATLPGPGAGRRGDRHDEHGDWHRQRHPAGAESTSPRSTSRRASRRCPARSASAARTCSTGSRTGRASPTCWRRTPTCLLSSPRTRTAARWSTATADPTAQVKAWTPRGTARPRPATAMTRRSAVCGARRTTRGPSRPPTKSPIASGSAADQAIEANTMKPDGRHGVRHAEDDVLHRVPAGEASRRCRAGTSPA